MSLRQVRVDAHLTIDQLAVKSEVSPAQIRNIESGETSNPRMGTLAKLAAALDVEPSVIDPYTPRAAA